MTDSDRRRPLGVDRTILGLAFVVVVTMLSLGNGQGRRRAWKLDLIETVEARAFGTAEPAPLTAPFPEYQRVTLTGTFRHDLSLRIKAVTELGPGSWVMTPLETPEATLWVNRGFVPSGTVSWEQPDGAQQITGLIRADQPGGTLLEDNDPEAGRWVSADLALMSQTQGIETLGYYIDAIGGDSPRGGLTQITFRNNHLVYALTWYAMALLFAGAMAWVIYDRLRRGPE